VQLNKAKEGGMKGLALFCCLCSFSGLAVRAADLRDDERRIRESAVVLSEILHAPDRGISRDLIRKAYCVGVVPNLKRAGFVVAAKYGKGVVTCRVPGIGWSVHGNESGGHAKAYERQVHRGR
jgi:lipid-binding SYLF domain-containing protein